MRPLSSESVVHSIHSVIRVQRLLGAALLILSVNLGAQPWTPDQDDLVLEVLPKILFSTSQSETTRETTLSRKNTPADPGKAAAQAAELIALGREYSDPRYFGKAQAAIQSWWNLDHPPVEILLLRATLKQHHHQYSDAIKDLKKLTRSAPKHSQAWLTLSTIQMVQGDYLAAKQSCSALARSASSGLSTLCYGQLMALTGRAEEGYELIKLFLTPQRDSPLTHRKKSAKDLIHQQWLHTLLAEISLRQGKNERAAVHFRVALSMPRRDPYLLRVYSEFLLLEGEANKTISLLKNETQDDALLLQLALAAKQTQNNLLLKQYRRDFSARLKAANLRGDTLHQREHALFLLEIENDQPAALTLAENNWKLQKEPADARLLLAAAIRNGDEGIARQVIQWQTQNSLQDVQLQAMLSRAGGLEF